jgi:hypothetical protein
MTRKFRSNIWLVDINGRRVKAIIISADHFNRFDDHFQVIPISPCIIRRHCNDEIIPWRGQALQVNRILTVHESQLIGFDSDLHEEEMEVLHGGILRRFDL